MAKDLRPAIVCDDVKELTLASSSFMGDSDSESLIRLKQTQNAIIKDCRPSNAVNVFDGIMGSDTKGILLNGNLVQKTRLTFNLDKGVQQEAFREINSFR